MISFVIGRGNTHAQVGTPTRAPVATSQAATPDDAAIDTRRGADLQRLSDALAAYHQRHDTYPTTRNAITQVCGAETDAGCALNAITGGLVFKDGDDPYYYASDGARYVLMARAKVAGEARGCPVGLPAELVAGGVICMTSEGAR
jgi:hypothetical protein